jgi:hypothetical protein
VTWIGGDEVVAVAFLEAVVEDWATVVEVEREMATDDDAADVVAEVETTAAALEAAVLLETGAAVVAGADVAATLELVAGTGAVVAARTEAQADEAAARTDKASVAPQAARTQLVASLWMSALLAGAHWQVRSETLQVVAAVTALSIQLVAQAGI